MARKSSADVGFLLIGGRSVLGAPLTEIGESRERLVEQVDGLGDTDDKWGDVGVSQFEMTQSGFYNSGTGSYHEALELSNPQVLMYGPEGNAIGDDIVALSGVRTTYNRLPARGEFHKANAVYKAEDGPEELGKSRISAHHVARTTAGPTDTASHDWTAATTVGGAAYLGVSALTLGGYTNLTVKVRHSTDDISFSDLVTFTVVTSAPAAERKTIAGTINRYTLTRHEFIGAGSGQTATFAVGIGRS